MKVVTNEGKNSVAVSTKRCSALTGATVARLNRWATAGVFGDLEGGHRGGTFDWEPADVELAYVITQLSFLGAPTWLLRGVGRWWLTLEASGVLEGVRWASGQAVVVVTPGELVLADAVLLLPNSRPMSDWLVGPSLAVGFMSFLEMVSRES